MADVPDWVTLTDEERVLVHDRPSIYPYLVSEVGSMVVAVVGAIIALVGFGLIEAPFDLPIPEIVWLALGGLLLVIGIVGIVWGLLGWWSLEYLVTTAEVYKKHGIVSRSVTNVSIANIQETSFDQSVLGRLLSYGTVKIATAGTGGPEIIFRHAANPGELVSTISEQGA